MIKLYQVMAKKDIRLGKNATFTKGDKYIVRQTKNSKGMVAKSNEGFWIPVIYWGLHSFSSMKEFEDKFEVLGYFYVKNYKEIRSLNTSSIKVIEHNKL